jgi:hypothetical protein
LKGCHETNNRSDSAARQRTPLAIIGAPIGVINGRRAQIFTPHYAPSNSKVPSRVTTSSPFGQTTVRVPRGPVGGSNFPTHLSVLPVCVEIPPF